MRNPVLNMRSLFLVDGAFGSGKSMLANYIESPDGQGFKCHLMKKKTVKFDDRKIYSNVSKDLEVVSEEEFSLLKEKNSFYVYESLGQKYGIDMKDIADALLEYHNVFVIVRSHDLMKRIKNFFQNRASVHLVFMRALDGHGAMEVFRESGASEFEVQWHLDRRESAWQEYMKNSKEYDHSIYYDSRDERFRFDEVLTVLINNFGFSPGNYGVDKGKNEKIYKMLEKNAYHKNVFMMIRYSKRNYRLIETISKILESNGLNCISANMEEFNLIDGSQNPVALADCCRFGIAILNEARPSHCVCHEIGLMDGKERPVLLLWRVGKGKKKTYIYNFEDRKEHRCANDNEIIEKIKVWAEKVKREEI